MLARVAALSSLPPQRRAALTALLLGSLLAGCRETPLPAPSASPTPAASITARCPIRFVDRTDTAGITFRCSIPGRRPLNILQGIGYGCAFLDYDNDGNLDILLVGPKLALYKGDGQGHFTDVTHATGLDQLHGDFRGVAVGDYDNDGYDDLYISAYRGGVLLHNEQGKRFTDVTKAAGIAPQPWGSSATFVDIDGDGKLDLYIGNYVDFGIDRPQFCPMDCSPKLYPPLKGALYRNLGGSKFANVTHAWNADCVSGNTLGIAVADFDGSGRPSLALANDDLAGNLLQSRGKRLHDTARAAGTAFETDGATYIGMGIDWGDYDNDGKLDLAVGAFQQQIKPIFHNDGHGLFTDRAPQLGAAEAARPYVTFGMKWLDADNDGWLDLLIADGHVWDNVEVISARGTYREPTLLFHNEQQGRRLTDISGTALAGAAGRPIVGRGLAIGDFDNDGRVDALVVDAEGKPLLLHNETPRAGHWLEVHLIGVHCNRDGQGALLTMNTGTRRLLRVCTTAGSYQSASDKRVHFGLGTATSAQSLTVRWPDGQVDTCGPVPADQILTVTQGSTSPRAVAVQR